MIIGVPKESFPGEQRVALAPAVLPSLVKAGCELVVEAGAGNASHYPDAAYVEKGARGELGAKTGRGFLDWTPQQAQEVRARRDAFLIQFLRWEKARRAT